MLLRENVDEIYYTFITCYIKYIYYTRNIYLKWNITAQKIQNQMKFLRKIHDFITIKVSRFVY